MSSVKAIVAAAIAMLTLLPLAGAQRPTSTTTRRRRRLGPVKSSVKWILPPRSSELLRGLEGVRRGDGLRDRRARQLQLPAAAHPAYGVIPGGLDLVYSQVLKKPSRSRPEICSASAVNWAIVTLPPACAAIQVLAAGGRTRRRRSSGAARAVSSRRGHRSRRRRRCPCRGCRSRRPRRRGARSRGVLVEALLRGLTPAALAPEPLGVGREALVEPGVLPRATETRSPTHWCASSWATTASDAPAVARSSKKPRE